MEMLKQPLSYNHDADTISEAKEYMINRARQLLRLGYRLISLVENTWGIDCTFKREGREYQALYILKSHRGKGLYPSLVNKTILTSYQCNITDYLRVNGIRFVVEELDPFDEYKHISNYYGDARAKRSSVRYMNHIDEGLAILELINASDSAKKAYCMHPIYQSDEELKNNSWVYHLHPYVLINIIEYRSVANEYLSQRTITSLDEIRLSPLKDVNDMLIADKVQNYKDFEIYHKGKHERSDILDQYFRNWLVKLGVDGGKYAELTHKINIL